MRDVRGDPIRERRAREELASIKNQISHQDSQNAQERLSLVEAKAKLGAENRELQRSKNVLQERLEECEQLLAKKSNELNKA